MLFDKIFSNDFKCNVNPYENKKIHFSDYFYKLLVYK